MARSEDMQARMAELRLRMVTGTFSKRQKKADETIIAGVRGWVGTIFGSGAEAKRNGELILTDRRIAFYRKVLFGETIDTIPLERITGFDRHRLLAGEIVVHAQDGSAIHFKTMAKAELDTLAAELEKRTASAPTLVSHAGVPSTADEIAKLAALKERGLITDAEFASQKAKLLA